MSYEYSERVIRGGAARPARGVGGRVGGGGPDGRVEANRCEFLSGRGGLVRRLGRASVGVLLVLAAACGSVPQRHYYALSYPEEQPGASTRPALHPFRLRIKPFGVALPYNRPQVVYRQSPFEFNYYGYRLWAAKPQHMLRELVQRHLEAARLVSEVTQEYMEELPDYELSADVLAIEEYDSGDVWYGHLAMRFQLVRFQDQTPIWTYSFDRKRKVYEKQPVYVVRALSRIVEEELNRVAASLDEVFSQERGVPPTLVAPAPTPDEGPGERDPGPGYGGDVLIEPQPREPERGSPGGTPPPDDELIVPDEPGPQSRPGAGAREGGR